MYEIKKAYQTFGKESLAAKVRRKPRMPNQTPPELEQQILAMTEQYLAYSYVRVTDQLKLIGAGVSVAAGRFGELHLAKLDSGRFRLAGRAS